MENKTYLVSGEVVVELLRLKEVQLLSQMWACLFLSIAIVALVIQLAIGGTWSILYILYLDIALVFGVYYTLNVLRARKKMRAICANIRAGNGLAGRGVDEE